MGTKRQILWIGISLSSLVAAAGMARHWAWPAEELPAAVERHVLIGSQNTERVVAVRLAKNAILRAALHKASQDTSRQAAAQPSVEALNQENVDLIPEESLLGNPDELSATGAAPLSANPTASAQGEAKAALPPEEAVAQERVDAEWTDQVKMELAASVAANATAAATIVAVDCHETICKVELQHPDRTTSERFEVDVLRTASWVGDGVDMVARRTPDGHGRILTTLYLAKEASGANTLASVGGERNEKLAMATDGIN